MPVGMIVVSAVILSVASAVMVESVNWDVWGVMWGVLPVMWWCCL